ncbi:MAG: hypothetical protein ACFWUH_08550 [Limosilactobacillus fermentum]|jgi:AICAR transformylase/IMP cyclohydrolase PurH
MQDQDTLKEDCHDWEVVTDVKPTEDQLKAMMFAWKAVKHAKSNAIVVANNERTLGVGEGQPNRIDSLKIAVKHAGDLVEGSVLASDAFFRLTTALSTPANTASRRSFNQGARYATKTRLTWPTSSGSPW